MVEYYRTIFTIEESAQGLELLEKVANEARKWAEREFGESLDGMRGELEGTAGRLRFGMRSVNDFGIFRLVWEHADPRDTEFQWRLGLRLATEGDDMEADIEVQGMEGQGEASPDEFQARPPSLVSTLFHEFNCSLDGERLMTEARRVADTNLFLRDLLDPNRSIPLLVVSEEKSGNSASDKANYLQRQQLVEYGGLSVPGAWREKANHLQRQLLGLAKVVSYDHDTAWRIAKDLPRPLRCCDGAMRLYSPGCSESDVSQQHPYWLPSDMDKLGPDMMLRMLRDECVIRLPRQGRRRMFSRVRNAIRAEDTKSLESKIEELEQNRSDRDDELPLESLDLDELLELLELSDTDYEDSVPRMRYDYLMKNAKALNNRNKALVEEIKQYSSSPIDQLPDPPSPDPSDTPEPMSCGVLEVVQRADRELGGLRFFPSAFESAKSVTKSQFRRTDELYKTFYEMEECARKRSTGLGKNPAQWFRDRGVDYSPKESEQTWARYKEDRTFRDDDSGDFVYMEEHFKLRGENRFMLRIHVSWNKKESRWLVGYVGEHLPTSRDPH